jgi:membrane-bound lytic murein transglycosylase B
MARIPPAYERAFQRWGYLADAEARKWGLPNGATLLAKIGYVETRYSRDLGITSSAGARGPMQFMPETRAGYVSQYGVDPWASIDEAVHAAGIFMKTSGLDGYNPGSSTYIDEVKSAPVAIGAQATGPATGRANRGRARSTFDAARSTETGDPLIRFLLTAAFGLGGAALVGIGLSRAVGSSPASGATA